MLHSRGCLRVPFEEGRLLASLLPDARLVPLDTDNDVLLAEDPAFDRFFAELRAFLPGAAQSKGKERQRIVYLADKALAITKRLMARHLGGPLFLNTDGKPWTPDDAEML